MVVPVGTQKKGEDLCGSSPSHVALSSTLLATPAFARDGAWYVGGEFGAMIVEDSDVDIGAVDNAIRLNYDYGYDGGIFVGYDLGAFRIEAEVAYKKADLDSFNTVIQLPGEGTVFAASAAVRRRQRRAL